MRWILLLLGLVGFAVAFTTRSPAVLGIGLVAGLIGLFGFAFALAAARIAANAQPESTMIVDREVNALRKQARATAAKTDPVEPAGN